MCEAGLLARGIGQADFIKIELFGKSVVLENRELVHALLPISACPVPAGRDVSQGQPNQLCGRIVFWGSGPAS